MTDLSAIYVFSYFPFGFEGRMLDLIASVPDHCLSFYFTCALLHTYVNFTYLCKSENVNANTFKN